MIDLEVLYSLVHPTLESISVLLSRLRVGEGSIKGGNQGAQPCVPSWCFLLLNKQLLLCLYFLGEKILESRSQKKIDFIIKFSAENCLQIVSKFTSEGSIEITLCGSGEWNMLQIKKKNYSNNGWLNSTFPPKCLLQEVLFCSSPWITSSDFVIRSGFRFQFTIRALNLSKFKFLSIKYL